MIYLYIILISLTIASIYPAAFEINFRCIDGYIKFDISGINLMAKLIYRIYSIGANGKGKPKNTKFKDIVFSRWKNPKYQSFGKFLFDKIIIQKIICNIEIGCLDVCATSILTGILWSLKGIIAGFIFSKKRIQKLSYNVLPVFNKNRLYVYLNCIIKIRLVYIIIAWVWLQRIIEGGVMDGTSYRRFDENYNE